MSFLVKITLKLVCFWGVLVVNLGFGEGLDHREFHGSYNPDREYTAFHEKSFTIADILKTSNRAITERFFLPFFDKIRNRGPTQSILYRYPNGHMETI